MKQIRQGDVFLIRVNETSGKKVGSKQKVLAEGEITGHFHQMVGDVDFFETKNGQVLCQVNSSAELTHQEHENIQIPKGIYEVRIQREYDVVKGIRQVLD